VAPGRKSNGGGGGGGDGDSDGDGDGDGDEGPHFRGLPHVKGRRWHHQLLIGGDGDGNGGGGGDGGGDSDGDGDSEDNGDSYGKSLLIASFKRGAPRGERCALAAYDTPSRTYFTLRFQ
jgi:hypothetical protein